MNASYLSDKFAAGLPYDRYVATGTDEQQRRWRQVYDAAKLTPEQTSLLASFTRNMKVLIVSGIWCGDCVQQCPLLQRAAEANAGHIELRLVDRDVHRDLTEQVRINGGDRVPVALFLAEDFEVCSIFGDRTLQRYRALAPRMLGPSCPTGLMAPPADELAATLQDWIDEYERIQLMLRLSARACGKSTTTEIVMKFLVTNDDGIDAAGLAALTKAAAYLGSVTTVAPVDALSGCSHRVTTSQTFRVLPRLPGSYAVEGTPADCVRVALHEIAPDADWVLSGVNHGGNLGADVWHSGTVAAVREAVLHGWRAIAFSQLQKKGQPVDWERVSDLVRKMLPGLLAREAPQGSFFNVNFPHLEPGPPDPNLIFAPLDPTPLPLSFRREGDTWRYDGDYHQRRRKPGCDIDVCFSGSIAVTELRLL